MTTIRSFASLAILCIPALGQDASGKAFRFLGQADYGKCTMSHTPDMGEEAFNDMLEDLDAGTNWSVSGGLLNPAGTLGGGVLFQSSRFESSLDDETSVDISGAELVVTNMEAVETRTLVAGLLFLRHPLGEKVVWASEVGLGQMTKRVEINDMEGTIYAGASTMDMAADLFIEGSGVALVLGTGLDFFLTPNFGIGAKFQFVKSTVSANSSNATMQIGSTSIDDEIEDIDDDDASQGTFSGGVRVLF